jgi:glycosyltransferase involved in cell wall biosynthesis
VITPATHSNGDPIRVVHIIARLNIGGPAVQAITLTKELVSLGYRTILVRGIEEPDEGNMDHLADELGVRPVLVPWLRRNPGWHDLPALLALTRILRRERPEVVHTHAAKGGTIGRVAALLACRGDGRRCVLVHTYHGHSLSCYFSARANAVYLQVERFLARFTPVLIAVSEEVRDELVGLGVAPPEKFIVVRLGFDLSGFTVAGEERERQRRALRAELGVPSDARVVTLVARLVPIKRVDRFLRVANLLPEDPDVRFLVVGDGELRDELSASADARRLGDRLLWAGFRRDMPAVCFASDVVVLTSDNEGTPASLIEAQASRVPVVSTNVGGAATVVHADTGRLISREDESGFAAALQELLGRRDLAQATGLAAAARARADFTSDRLVRDLDRIYRRLLHAASPTLAPAQHLEHQG